MTLKTIPRGVLERLAEAANKRRAEDRGEIDVLPPPAPGETPTERLTREHTRQLVVLSRLLILLTRGLEDLRKDTIEPPRGTTGPTSWLVREINVKTAGKAVRGPDLAIPRGFVTVVRMRHHTGTPTGYVASEESALGTSAGRSELRDGDHISLLLPNWEALYFDADTDSTRFELIVER